jgi:very-short-patch-repair endonuclease
VDFYCAVAQLVIELDGVTHRDRAVMDRDRQKWLEARGLKVLRCTNEDLYENFDGLLEAIWLACRSRAPLTPALSPPFARGEGGLRRPKG